MTMASRVATNLRHLSFHETDVFRFLIPKVGVVSLKRIGPDCDGGYLVPDDLDGVVACFSPGAESRKAFEDDLTLNYGIRSHICDFSCDAADFSSPLIEGLQTFRKKWLGAEPDEQTITLEQWVGEYESGVEDLILQMDIEGAEYEVLAAAPQAVLRRFRIIVLELHHLGEMRHCCDDDSPFARSMGKLAEEFEVVHVHANGCGGESPAYSNDSPNIPHVLELTLHRRDRLKAKERTVLPQAPHPLDIAFNAPGSSEIFLSDAWLPLQASRDRSRAERLSRIRNNPGSFILTQKRQIDELQGEIARLRRRLDHLTPISRVITFLKSVIGRIRPF